MFNNFVFIKKNPVNSTKMKVKKDIIKKVLKIFILDLNKQNLNYTFYIKIANK